MPTGFPVPQDQRQKIYTAYCLGETNMSIADRMDLSVVTVRRIVREERKRTEKERDMARSGKIVKKDGRGGKLMALPNDGFEFTHVTSDGKSHKKKVDGHISRIAEQQYDKWCSDLDAECEFMNMVERKNEGDSESEVVCGHPGDPIEEIHPIQPAPVPEINVRPWRDVANEREEEIASLKARIEELENSRQADGVIADTELPEPKLNHWWNNNGSFAVVCLDKPAYAIWAKTDKPMFYGLYRTMEQALKKVDELNDVAKFLGQDGAFEVEEVAWRA